MKTRKLFRADHKARKVVETTGTEYPSCDRDGEKIFVNTHFVAEDAAWKCLIENAEAWVSLAGRAVADDKARLREAERRAGEAAEGYAEAKSNYDDWKRSQK